MQSSQIDDEQNLLQSPKQTDPYEKKTFRQKLADLWATRKKFIIGGVAGFILLIIIIIIIVAVSGGSKSPSPPGPAPPTPAPDPDPGDGPDPTLPDDFLTSLSNPYSVISQDTPVVGAQVYNLQRDAGPETEIYDVLDTYNNSYVDQIKFQVFQINYQTVRLQFLNSNQTIPQFQIPDSYLNSEYLNNYKQGLIFNNTAFEVLKDPNDYYYYVNIRSPYSDDVLFTTYDSSFVQMDHYQQVGFRVNASALYGLGERYDNFYLKEGNYTIFTNGADNNGMHPFMLARLFHNHFIGIFFFNSNAQEYQITYHTQEIDHMGTMINMTYANVVYTSTGGIIDIFTFSGPSYQDVIAQYQQVIGTPKLLPKWIHGFISGSQQYFQTDKVVSAIQILRDANIPVDSIAIDEKNIISPLDLSYNVDLDQIESNGVYVVQAYTSLVPLIGSTSEVTVRDQILKANVSVTTEGWGVQVREDDQGQNGVCFDFFNPKSQPILTNIFSPLQTKTRGIWFQDNSPQYDWNNISGVSNISNPFYSIPYWPGMHSNQYHFNDNYSLPFNSVHQVGFDQNGNPIVEYHYNLHGLFGSQMAKQVQSVTKNQNVMISEQTFAGDGHYGIAHTMLQEELSSSSLNDTVSSILGFNMFGIPYVSPNLCGFTIQTSASTPFDCVKSFQLAFVSPMAFSFNDKDPIIKQLTSNNTWLGAQIASLLNQRLKYVVYTRAELYKLQDAGGALVRPIFADFHHYFNFSYDSVLYGDSLLVEFNFQNSTHKTITLPAHDWVNLMDNTLIQNGSAAQQSQSYQVSDSQVLLFQKAGTIVPYQETVVGQSAINTLSNVPLSLRAVIQHGNHNIGHVLFDNMTSGTQDFYEIKANNHFMIFKPQTNITVDSTSPQKQISNITFHFINSTGISQACAIMNDYNTVKPMYINSTMQDPTTQYHVQTVTPNDPTNSSDTTTMSIDDVAMIFYGYSDDYQNTMTCQQLLYSYVTGFNYTNQTENEDWQLYTISMTPNLKNLIPTMQDYIMYVLYFRGNITLFRLQQNYTMADQVLPVYNTSEGIDQMEINNTMTINLNPFYLNIHGFNDSADVYLSTMGQIMLLTQELTILGFTQPNVDPNRMFGLGERAGHFFLEHKKMYSMFTNANNIQDIQGMNGRSQTFTKNGYYPYIIAEQNNQNGESSVYNYTSINLQSGIFDVYMQLQNITTQQPMAITQIVSPNNYIDVSYMYNMDLKSIYKDISQNFFGNKSMNFPPDYSYGQYAKTQNINSFDQLYQLIMNYTNASLPLEGFYLDYSMLENFQSLTYNSNIFTAANIKNLTSLNVAVIVKLLAGIPLGSKEAEVYLQNNTYLKSPYMDLMEVGEDQTGKVLYPDFGTANFTEVLDFIATHKQTLMNFQQETNTFSKFSVETVQNELTNVYCKGNCRHQYSYSMEPWQLYKVGINNQLKHSFNFNNSFDNHNLYGTQQSATYALTSRDLGPRMVISSSTGYASQWFGNVARVADYFTPQDSYTKIVQSLMTLSIGGMPNLGFQWDINQNSDANINLLSTLMPMSIASFDTSQLTGANVNPNYSLKLMLIKYIKAQVYISTTTGYPFLRPFFLDYPAINDFYTSDFNIFMYGNNILVNLPMSQATPYAYWCEIAYLVTAPNCFDSLSNHEKKQLLLKGGSIVPLQDPFQGLYPNTSMLIRNASSIAAQKIDLHVIFSERNFDAHGFILLESGGTEQPCLLQMSGYQKQINFTISGDNSAQCQTYAGYNVGKLILYDYAHFNYSSVTINSGTPIPTATDATRNYTFYDLSSQVSQIQSIHQLNFQ